MFSLILVSFIQSLLFLQTSSAAQPSPAEILRGTLKAVENIESVEYEVRREYKTSEGNKFKGRTTILASRSPFRFSARLQAEDAPITQIAVSDGKTTRGSSDGKTNETNTFAPRYLSERVMPYVNDANLDVSATWRLPLDTDFLKEAIAGGSFLYVKQEDIEGDLCHVVLSVRSSALFESITEYYWISVKTGLPRAMQRLTLTRGGTNLNPRFTISKIRINPAIPADTFAYKPKATDSTAVTGPKAATANGSTERSLVGSQLPALEVRDVEFKPLKLSDYSGKPTIINFWATWCGPCIPALKHFNQLSEAFKGKPVRFITITDEDEATVTRFMKSVPISCWVGLDDNGATFSAYNASQRPYTVVINRSGRIAAITDHRQDR